MDGNESPRWLVILIFPCCQAANFASFHLLSRAGSSGPKFLVFRPVIAVVPDRGQAYILPLVRLLKDPKTTKFLEWLHRHDRCGCISGLAVWIRAETRTELAPSASGFAEATHRVTEQLLAEALLLHRSVSTFPELRIRNPAGRHPNLLHRGLGCRSAEEL